MSSTNESWTSKPNDVTDELRVAADDKSGGQKADGKGSITLQHQDSLPKLPIPPLKETCARYIRAVEALQDSLDHAKTKKVVEAFIDNEGPSLHEKLQEYASNRASYIEEFWDESYLNQADSVVLSLNPFFILEDDPTPSRGNQLMRASSLILAALGFVHDLRTGQLQPDYVKGVPLDMYQYTRMFGTARVPNPTGCTMETDSTSSHVVILRRGQFYWFDVLDSSHRPCLTERELLDNLKAVVDDADRTPRNQVAQAAVGTLTTENRRVWAHLRQVIHGQRKNKACLDVVEKALFVVCLDDSTPETASEMCSNMLCGTYKLDRGVQVGTCTNRWYDKLQIIVAANGAAGVNFEHSGVDGLTVLRFVGDIYTELILRFAKSINSSSQTLFKAKLSPWASGGGGRKPHGEEGEETEEIDTAPKKLEWDLTPELRAGVRFAETRLSDLICQNEVVALEFENYGKSFITRHGFSPDGFVQMAFQAAYFSLYGRTESTYEPAMTKMFLHGRTEAIRTVQPASVHFTKTFCSDASSKDKLAALREACKAHVNLTRDCAKGLGQDRLMYAMYCLSVRDQNKGQDKTKNGSDHEVKPLPEIFRDPGYTLLNHSTISTSNCGNPALRLFGFGAVVPDGFGIGYIIKDDGLSFVAASKHLQTPRFLETLRAYFIEVQRMIQHVHRQANEHPIKSFVDHSGRQIDSRTGRPLGEALLVKDTVETGRFTPPIQAEDTTGGYGFFDSGDIDRLLASQRLKAKSKTLVGTRLKSSDY